MPKSPPNSATTESTNDSLDVIQIGLDSTTTVKRIEIETDRPHKCTDVPCCLLFLLALGGMGYVAYLGYLYGDAYRLVYGVDSWGNGCNTLNNIIENITHSGVNTIGKTKIFYYSTLAISQSVWSTGILKSTKICISQCPNETIKTLEDLKDYYDRTGVNFCRYDITADEFYNGRDDDTDNCPNLPIKPHVDILNTCYPKTVVDVGKSMFSSITNTLDVILTEYESERCDSASSWMKNMASDIYKTKKEIIYCTLIAFGISGFVALMLKFIAPVFIWTMVIGCAIGSTAGTVWIWVQWHMYKQDLANIPEDLQLESEQKLVKHWMYYAIAATVFTSILLLILLVMRSRIGLVVQLFREAGAALGKMPLILIQPIWTMSLLVGTLLVVGLASLYVASAGHPEIDEFGHVSYESDQTLWYLKWYFLFMVLWIIQFIVACQDMVVASAVSTWYFIRYKDEITCCNRSFVWKSVIQLIKYHMGTIAFGSFIIAVIQLIRIILAYLQRQLKGRTSKVAEYVLKCMQCCFWCLEKLLKFINRNAYIMTAITSDHFCTAAKKAFDILVANIVRVGAINSIGKFTLFLGDIMVVALTLLTAMQIIPEEKLCFFFAPLMVVGVIAFIISYSFMNIYGMTIDTLFLCFCADCQMNDGEDKPYFMSVGLKQYIDSSIKLKDLKVSKSKAIKVKEVGKLKPV